MDSKQSLGLLFEKETFMGDSVGNFGHVKWGRDEIEKILPHRYEMLLLDGVNYILPGKQARGKSNADQDRWFFRGHFPEYPVMPGALIVEALAQLGAVALLTLPENKGKIVFFAGIDKVRFRGKVLPGETLSLNTRLIKLKGRIGLGSCTAKVGEKLVCAADLMFALQEPS